jgi:N-acetyltransferase 10
LTLGLQQREVSDLQQELGLPSNQVLALFNKAIRKLHAHLRSVKEAAVERQLPRPPPRAAPAAAAAAGALDVLREDASIYERCCQHNAN